jgi:hypothetical protein
MRFDLAGLDHEKSVAYAYGREPMGDDQDGLSGSKVLNGGHHPFSNPILSRCNSQTQRWLCGDAILSR